MGSCLPLTWLLASIAACTPDAGFSELAPVPIRAPCLDEFRTTEMLQLLGDSQCHDYESYAHGERKTFFEAYPEPCLAYPRYTLSGRRKPKQRGCQRLLIEIKHALLFLQSLSRYKPLTRYHHSKQKKPYSAISVQIEQLTSETYQEDDLAGIPDLLEVTKLQATGPTELARAVRKKLKYGNVHRQLRALTILDGVLQNGGQRLQRVILDDPMLSERLRMAAVDPISDPDVRQKCETLFSQWVASSAQQPGLAGAKALYQQLPRKKAQPSQQQRREQSRVLQETERDAFADPEDEDEQPRSRAGSSAGLPQPSGSVHGRKNSAQAPITLEKSSLFGMSKLKKDKKSKMKRFKLETERPAILQAIAASSVSSSNLNNALKLVNREHKRVSEDVEVMKRFETCKHLRRQILRYIQYVETDELLGGLIDANERLIEALMAWEVMDQSVENDSDSELEEATHQSRMAKRRDDAAVKDAEKQFANMSVAPPKPARPTQMKVPPRPAKPPPMVKKVQKPVSNDEDSEDENDPFADSHVAPGTPEVSSKQGFSWKEV